MSTATSTSGRAGAGVFEPRQLVRSLPDALRKLDPRVLVRSPVMFVVEVGAVLTTVLAVADPGVFAWSIVGWLWLTVVFGAGFIWSVWRDRRDLYPRTRPKN